MAASVVKALTNHATDAIKRMFGSNDNQNTTRLSTTAIADVNALLTNLTIVASTLGVSTAEYEALDVNSLTTGDLTRWLESWREKFANVDQKKAVEHMEAAKEEGGSLFASSTNPTRAEAIHRMKYPHLDGAERALAKKRTRDVRRMINGYFQALQAGVSYADYVNVTRNQSEYRDADLVPVKHVNGVRNVHELLRRSAGGVGLGALDAQATDLATVAGLPLQSKVSAKMDESGRSVSFTHDGGVTSQIACGAGRVEHAAIEGTEKGSVVYSGRVSGSVRITTHTFSSNATRITIPEQELDWVVLEHDSQDGSSTIIDKGLAIASADVVDVVTEQGLSDDQFIPIADAALTLKTFGASGGLEEFGLTAASVDADSLGYRYAVVNVFDVSHTLAMAPVVVPLFRAEQNVGAGVNMLKFRLPEGLSTLGAIYVGFDKPEATQTMALPFTFDISAKAKVGYSLSVIVMPRASNADARLLTATSTLDEGVPRGVLGDDFGGESRMVPFSMNTLNVYDVSSRLTYNGTGNISWWQAPVGQHKNPWGKEQPPIFVETQIELSGEAISACWWIPRTDDKMPVVYTNEDGVQEYHHGGPLANIPAGAEIPLEDIRAKDKNGDLRRPAGLTAANYLSAILPDQKTWSTVVANTDTLSGLPPKVEDLLRSQFGDTSEALATLNIALGAERMRVALGRGG